MLDLVLVRILVDHFLRIDKSGREDGNALRKAMFIERGADCRYEDLKRS